MKIKYFSRGYRQPSSKCYTMDSDVDDESEFIQSKDNEMYSNNNTTKWSERFGAQLNEGQNKALDDLAHFVYSKTSQYFVLEGYAGVGKTFLMGKFADAMIAIGKRNKIFFTATTNKAAKVLRSKMPVECTTIYSLLGLRIAEDDEQPRLLPVDKDEADDALRNAYIVIDEASMLTTEVMQHIYRAVSEHNAYFIFVGDPAQLPPVEKEDDENQLINVSGLSPCWDLIGQENVMHCVLSQIVRYDGPIEKLATRIREMIYSTSPSADILIETDTLVDEKGKYGVFAPGLSAYNDWLISAAKRNLFLEDDKVLALAFTNKHVDFYNRLIRQTMFGVEGAQENWRVGERFVMTKPFRQGSGKDAVVIARNRDEFVIIDKKEEVATVKFGSSNVEYRVIHLFTNYGVTLPIVHPLDVPKFNNNLRILSESAKQATPDSRKWLWREFWEHKNAFAEIAYAYAMTLHCSQGSTYEIVFVDWQNIKGVKKAPLLTRLRSFYVGGTRPSRILVIN